MADFLCDALFVILLVLAALGVEALYKILWKGE